MNSEIINDITEDGMLHQYNNLKVLQVNEHFVSESPTTLESAQVPIICQGAEIRISKDGILECSFTDAPPIQDCESPEDEGITSFSQICRFCLERREEMQFIYNADSCIPEAIMMFAAIQLHANDGLPKQMCSQCMQQLSRVFAFKQQVETADEYLRQYCSDGVIDNHILLPIEVPENVLFSTTAASKTDVEKEPTEYEINDNFLEPDGTEVPVADDNIVELEILNNYSENNSCNSSEPATETIVEHILENTEDFEENSPKVEYNNCSPEIKIRKSERKKIKKDQEQIEMRKSERKRKKKGQEQIKLRKESIDELDEPIQREPVNECVENGSLFCNVCCQQFTEESDLEEHEKICSQEANETIKFPPNEEPLETIHENDDEEEEDEPQEKDDSNDFTYTCKSCNMGFNIESDLLIHFSIHSNDGKNMCLQCKKEFTTSFQLKRHIAIHFEDKPHKCHICNKGFPEIASLTRHFRLHTGERREKKHACNTCGNQYYDSHALNVHLRKHTGERPWACTICQKSFSDSRLLNSHMKVHSGMKPYVCEICKKSFTHQSTLRTHVRTHTGEKPYICSTCGKSFIQSSNLSLHMRVHSGEKPYACNVCNRSFASSSTLTTHKRTHTGEKPYTCLTCGKHFVRQDLSAHMRTHTGEKPFICPHCDKKFTTSGHLNQHIRTHTGTKQYQCTVCLKRCSSITYLKKHMRIHHEAPKKTEEEPSPTLDENSNSNHSSYDDEEDNESSPTYGLESILETEEQNSIQHGVGLKNDLETIQQSMHDIDNTIITFNTNEMLNSSAGNLINNISMHGSALTTDGLPGSTAAGALYSSLDGKYIYQAIDPSIMRIQEVHSGAQLSENCDDIIR